ncbi:MAG TPA: SIMPL domain-containing protein [Methylovirgula sp.]
MIVPSALRHFASALAFAAAFGLSNLPASADTPLKESVPTITVMGTAKTEIVPDIAILSIAVVTERPRAAAAGEDNARAAQAMIDEIKAEGIDAKDISTVSITLSPVYDEARDAEDRVLKRTLRAYQARNLLAIRLHAIDKAGALARKLLDKGANEFQGISFDSDEKEAAYAKLRGQAVENALSQAKAYVAPVGLRLARILDISPMETDREKLSRYAMDGIAAGAPAPSEIPIEPGTITLEAQVQVVWELSPQQK